MKQLFSIQANFSDLLLWIINSIKIYQIYFHYETSTKSESVMTCNRNKRNIWYLIGSLIYSSIIVSIWYFQAWSLMVGLWRHLSYLKFSTIDNLMRSYIQQDICNLIKRKSINSRWFNSCFYMIRPYTQLSWSQLILSIRVYSLFQNNRCLKASWR